MTNSNRPTLQAESIDDQVLIDWPRSADAPKRRRRGSISAGWLTVEPAAMALVAIGAALAVSASYGAGKELAWSLAVLCLAGVTSTIIHELAHAVTARKYGFAVDYIQVGLGGSVEWYPVEGRAPARQIRNVVAAGILSHVVQFIVGAAAVVAVVWTSAWFLPLWTYASLNLARAIENFVPRTVKGNYWPAVGGFNGHPNDGRILQRLRRSG